MLKPAVFLDRDNTLVHGEGTVRDLESVRLIKGVGSAVASLKGLGYEVLVVTNQPGVAMGEMTEDAVRAVHLRLAEMVEASANGARIDGFYFCPFDPDGVVEAYRGDHEDRKPRPGMLLGAAEDHGLDLSRSWMVGDRERDVLAGQAAGVRTVLVGPDAEERAGGMGEAGPDYIAETLVEAVRVIAHRGGVKGEGRGGVDGAELEGVEVGRRWDAAAVARVQKASATLAAEPGVPTGAAVPLSGAAEVGANVSSGQTSQAKQQGLEESGRGFVPVGAGGGDAGPPIAEPAYRKVLRSVAAGVQERVSAWRDGREETDQPERQEADQVSEASDGGDRGGEAPEDRAESPVAETARVTPVTEASEADSAVLRAILAELRAQRRTGSGVAGAGRREFDGVMVFALVLQMAAVVCLLGGLFMGAGDLVLLVKWLGAGVMAQVASIGLVVFSRG
ncbi:MAG: HAD family hydrolase [Planctomycetota bacterium]